jgi:hypothetical protein
MASISLRLFLYGSVGKQKAALLLGTESGSLVYYQSLAFLAKQEKGAFS